MAFDDAAILDLGRVPVPGASPVGQDVADDENYLLLDAELAKLDRIDLGEVDWFRVEQAATDLLRSKSKDFHVAVCLAYALIKKQRYPGLAASLGLFIELTRNFWDGAFPARERRRKARMESVCEQVVELGWYNADNKPRDNEFDFVDQALARLKELETLLTEKMPDDAPDFSKIYRKLKEIAGTRPKAPEPAPSAPSGDEGDESGGGGGGGGAGLGAIEDVPGALTACLTAATFLSKADVSSPLSYALVRLVRWAQIELPTPEIMAQLPAPEKTVVDALEFQCAGRMWDVLLNSAEEAFRACDPLWLDVQRYACVALAGMGAKFDGARTTIMELTGGLVRRLGNGLFDLRFREGVPLCSGETKMWLETEVLAAQGGGGGGGGGGMSNGKLTEAWDAARQLAGTGKLSEAVKNLADGLATCSQRRDRFLWRLRIAQLCLDSQRLSLAAPLLEECYDELRRYHIEDWEPTLAVEAAQTLYRCRKALLTGDREPTPEELGRVRESFAWLCQLDPVAALAAEPAGK